MDLIKCKWCGEDTPYLATTECADLRHAVDRDRELVRRMLKDADGCVIRNEAYEEEVKAMAKKRGKTMIEVAAALFGVSPAFLDCADGLLKAAQSVMSKPRVNSKRDGNCSFQWDGSYLVNNGEIFALHRAISNYVKLRSKA